MTYKLFKNGIIFLYYTELLNHYSHECFFSNELYQHNLSSLQCSEADCFADFVLQKDIRLNHPGACSLEFQSVMEILMECMLRWDIKKKTTRGKGILGTVVAFSGADEEQGRKTINWHWQIWVTEIKQTVQNCLFNEDITIRDRAGKTFCKQIDNVLKLWCRNMHHTQLSK